MTGTPLDLTQFGPLLSAVGWIYWGFALIVAGLALWLPRRWWVKLPLSVAVLAAFIYPVATHVRERREPQADARGKIDEAKALFTERCKTAGERIVRTVDNVEGVEWLKWREGQMNYDDQFKLDDPYGRDCGADECIAKLLRVTMGGNLNPEEAERHRRGYRFVESVDPSDQQRYRYTARLEEFQGPNSAASPAQPIGASNLPAYRYQFKVYRSPTESRGVRYGVTWDDISTRADRKHWIAGGSLKVVDLQTNEVIAERVGFLWDPGQGSKAGFRSPWLAAEQYACPEFSREPNSSRRGRTLHETLNFVSNVLHPVLGE